MAANVRTEMRIPTRTAPRPPVNSLAQRSNVWGSTNDIFATSLTSQPVQKKKPPPRPPPPKFNQCHTRRDQRDPKSKKPTRPTELLTNFFAWKAAKQEHSNTSRSTFNLSHIPLQSSNTNGALSLIDLSPPGSPTFTTRSSSDGVSIDSFGSDGNSNPSVFTSSGNTSQTESAFEDDFDFFGMSNKKFPSNDPWQMKPMSDPFGPIEERNAGALEDVRQIGDTSFFAFNDNSTGKQVPFGQTSSKVIHSVPTIIRPKPPKPPAPKILKKQLEQKMSPSSSVQRPVRPLSEPISVDSSYPANDAWGDDLKDEPSPPMPTIPPPAPPSEYLVRSKNEFEESSNAPYGIALYDFPVTHSDDLPLKEGDVVTLIRVVNDDWMEGRIGNRQGIFPINFLDVKVPLPGLQDNVVVALYPFKGEAMEDLTFEEGAKIKVLSRLSDDWLYGEYKGRKGQFPTNYVNRIPYSISRST
ncbi:SH3 domain-containing protein 19-like isoform X1 [Vespula pensylvanica]|uniref:SH3 domain-containing protein 19-like isoform X1 n=2 Tax=Vespula pensylvanica TaxID=30213 RepID=UPI001CBA4525|nr:SH3 domain-containing protein 19-like isoform X1 [Vespula pensylvanica]